MLQSVRNQQTMRILDRLRKQGAPDSGKGISLDMTQNGGDEEGASPGPDTDPGDQQPDEQEEETPEGAGGIVRDSGMPGMSQGLRAAKKQLKRRY